MMMMATGLPSLSLLSRSENVGSAFLGKDTDLTHVSTSVRGLDVLNEECELPLIRMNQANPVVSRDDVIMYRQDSLILHT